MGSLISLNGVQKRFGQRTAVDGVSFEIPSGVIFGLLGPNGAGKTTTISMIVGSLSTDSGTITIEGKPMAENAYDAKRWVGYVPQEIALYEDLSSDANLEFFGSLYGISGQELSESSDRVLSAVGLLDRRKDPVHSFSGGMKRRLNIAVALLHKPKILVLDEPTVGVDPQSRNQIFESLESLNRAGLTILYTSHYMEEVERLCHRIAIMDHGKIIAQGSAAELRNLIPSTASVKLRFESEPGEAVLAQLKTRFADVAFADGELEIRAENTRAVLAEVDRALPPGVEYSSVRSEQLGLEDVFLTLTGKELRD